MSGIVGLINLDGEPIDRGLLCALTRSIAGRGPDGQEIVVDDHVGFGHSMFRTTREAAGERQPCSVDGKTWIVADCRLDARAELIDGLKTRVACDLRSATDPELILHAYSVWGADCAQHLLGDFSFAIWDSRTRRLVCARDHLGIKLFYYALSGKCLVFSNTLASLRLHPAVSDRLNEQAIGDFLMFGFNQDLSSTSFHDIRRLPPAHTLVCTREDVRVASYWTLPVDSPMRFTRAGEVVERFLELARIAVDDRVRGSSVGILMSGGLDSAGLAALAQQRGAAVRAYTNVFDRLVPDRERYFAGLVAAHLGIPIAFRPVDEYAFFEAEAAFAPDPEHATVYGPAPPRTELGLMAAHGRVAFFGEGPDNALTYEWKPYLSFELKRGRIGPVLKSLASFPFIFGQLPFAERIARARNAVSPPIVECRLPAWLHAAFVERNRLDDRWRRCRAPRRPLHPVRPRAYGSFTDPDIVPLWVYNFEGFDPGITGVQLEMRHPYLDLRLLRFLLAVPVLPWCRNKHLLRQAFRGALPAEVVARPKSPLTVNPLYARWKETGLPAGVPAPQLSEYVDLSRLHAARNDSATAAWVNIRPWMLNAFIRGTTLAKNGPAG